MSLPVKVQSLRRRTRFVLILGIFGGVLTTIFFFFFRSSPNITFDVFYTAAGKSMEGQVIYRTERGLYVYTPVVLLFFYPFVWLFEFQNAILIFRFFNIAVLFGYAALVVQFLDQQTDINRFDRILIGAFVIGTVYPVTVIATANMGIVFGSLLGIGFVLLERNRDTGGAVWALASIIKGFPALWGLYLLRVQRWKAIASAIVTGVGATLLGIFLFGIDAYIRFFTGAASDRVRIQRFAGGNSPDNEAVTPVRPLAQLFPDVDPHLWIPIIILLVLTLTATSYYVLPTNELTDRATILLMTVISITFAMPTSQDLDVYLVYVPLLVLLYLERDDAVHNLYALGTIVISYNIGREELRIVFNMIHEDVSNVIMLFAEPTLAFASMPLYGLLILYAGCLLKTWHRGQETGRIDPIEKQIRELI